MKNNNLLFMITTGSIILIGAIVVAFNLPQQAQVANNPTTTTQTSTTNPAESQQAPLPTSSRELVKSCTTDMATQFHIHQRLVILIDKKPLQIPTNIGINPETQCMSPMHTHTTDGIIHVESPVRTDFTLGDFFYNWKVNFSKNQIGEFEVDKEHGLKLYVEEQESNDFENLILKDNQEITIVYYKLSEGPGKLPPSYPWGD